MNSSPHRPPIFAWGLALLIAAGGVLLSTPGAQAAANRGAVLVKDIHPGRSGSTSGPGSPGNYIGGELTNVSGTLYFSAEDGRHGYELWRSDGTRKGTRMVKDINPGAGSSSLYGITAVNRTLYFNADDGVHGNELWRSDGTARGTRMVKDISPGAGSNSIDLGIDVSGTVYFFLASADDAYRGLWRSDGTEAGTSLVKQLPDVGRSALIQVNGILYFAAGAGLWRSDGTESGTSLVKSPFVGNMELTAFRGLLHFRGDDGVHGNALWRSDGTEAGTTMVKYIGPDNSDQFPCCFTELNTTLYFLGLPNELWRSDGTEAGTTLVKELKGGIGEGTAVKRTLYFSAGGGLWRSDGTPRGTTLVTRNRGSGPLYPRSLTAAKRCAGARAPRGRLYFVGTDRRNGRELWRSDGTSKGTRLVRNIRRGADGGQPQNLTAAAGSLFFTAKDRGHGRELWRAGAEPCKPAKGKRKKG